MVGRSTRRDRRWDLNPGLVSPAAGGPAGRMRSAGWAVALGLVLGGALGNLSDRLFRAPGVLRGHVVDWISAFGPYGEHWPIFNVADSAIVCGAVLAAGLAVLGIDI